MFIGTSINLPWREYAAGNPVGVPLGPRPGPVLPPREPGGSTGSRSLLLSQRVSEFGQATPPAVSSLARARPGADGVRPFLLRVKRLREYGPEKAGSRPQPRAWRFKSPELLIQRPAAMAEQHPCGTGEGQVENCLLATKNTLLASCMHPGRAFPREPQTLYCPSPYTVRPKCLASRPRLPLVFGLRPLRSLGSTLCETPEVAEETAHSLGTFFCLGVTRRHQAQSASASSSRALACHCLCSRLRLSSALSQHPLTSSCDVPLLPITSSGVTGAMRPLGALGAMVPKDP